MSYILLFNLIGNYWVGGPAKFPGTAGLFHGNPMNGNQPFKWPPTSTIKLKQLQWRNLPDPIPTKNPDSYDGCKELGTELAK